ncbi:nucleolar rna-associated protein [Holotrichia oblita]|uniref:Nucleolar rna-associated protein n=2 Tax=Holotrichia oblita TaxID=644536 RepID=A0ACB9TLE7_HOLOL|nr:nucleolar rna-associated protein [Holotrichia oblita]
MSDDNSSSENESLPDVGEMRKRKLTDSSPKRQKNKKNRSELLKAPTTEELNKLRETENLYSSNLIRLQIEEVLAEINVKQKFINRIEHWFNQVNGVIKNLEDKEDISIGEISLQTNEGLSKRSKFINALFENTTVLKHDKDFAVKFIHPESCSIFGEYQLQCLSKTDVQLNINVKIPAHKMYDYAIMPVQEIKVCDHNMARMEFSELMLMHIQQNPTFLANIICTDEAKFSRLQDKNRFATIYENIPPARKWKYYGFYDILIINELSNILRRGLTNRVSSIAPHIYQSIVAENSSTSNITFGINLNPEFAFNIIERGPSEDNPAAVKQFQEFWKGLTSFRRFQDSSVAEVVYFQCRTLQDKRNIFMRILEFLFTKKYPINIKVVANEFERVLKLEKTIIHFPTGTNEEACLKVKHIYTDLNKMLRGLQLPLIITNIQGSSDVFSYTEVFPPVPTTYKEDQDLQHINNKLILNQDIQKLLQYVAPIECVVQMGIVSYKDNEESLKLERELEILPKVTSALSGLHHSYPSFGPTCALIKRWLRSQMIDDYHISNTVINLWNASVFLNDPPYETAQLPQVAFLRFLKYLIDFDWKLNPVIVNFNDDISKSELSDIEARFQQNRNSYPDLYVVTPYDQSKSSFTKQHPSKHILKRIRLLASETYKFLIDAITKWDDFSVKDLFIPTLQGYDVLIYLKTTLNPLSHQNTFLYNSLDRSYIERYDKTVSTKMPVVDFNPVDKYIQELREIYGEYAVFFHDCYGGNVIGILWNKHVLEPRDFKVLHVNAKKLINGKLTINYDVILEDIYNRGYGLIKSIEKNVII